MSILWSNKQMKRLDEKCLYSPLLTLCSKKRLDYLNNEKRFKRFLHWVEWKGVVTLVNGNVWDVNLRICKNFWHLSILSQTLLSKPIFITVCIGNHIKEFNPFHWCTSYKSPVSLWNSNDCNFSSLDFEKGKGLISYF